MKKTLVIGANPNPERYAYKAVEKLIQNQHDVIAFGQKKGEINGSIIENAWNDKWNVDTVTLYINPSNQISYYQKIINLKPKRIIFNPGTENKEFMKLLEMNGIQCEEACTLVLLSLNMY